MNKYTISKAFQRKFQSIIWNIEIDIQHRFIAVETRDIETTLASVSVLNFDGTPVMADYQLDEKDWSLDSIHADHIIFKKIGDKTPVKEGVLIVNVHNRLEVYRSYEYTLLQVIEGHIKVRHRLYSSGLEEYIAMDSGLKSNIELSTSKNNPYQNIDYPILFTQQKPVFLQDILNDGAIWLSKFKEYYLWSYHVKEGNNYHLNLSISDSNEILVTTVLLTDLEKLIPQPYFQIDNQLFLMTYNKQEIVSYLV